MKKITLIVFFCFLCGCADAKEPDDCQNFPSDYAEVYFEWDYFQDIPNAGPLIYEARSNVAQCYSSHPFNDDMYVINYRSAKMMGERSFLLYDIEGLSGLYLLFEFDSSGRIQGSFTYARD